MCAFLLVYPLNVLADSPTAQIKATVDQVIQILTDTQLQGEAIAILGKLFGSFVKMNFSLLYDSILST